MSDNNINRDPNEPQSGDTPLNNEEKEIPKKEPESPGDPRSSGRENFVTNEKEGNEISINTPVEKNEESQKENIVHPDENVELPPEVLSKETITDKYTNEKSITAGGTAETSPSSTPQILTSKSKESNYQISLIDENLLKVVVTTNRGVKIDSTVKEDRSDIATQSNEINLHPRLDYSSQEVEVLIAIEELTNETSDEAIEQKTNNVVGPQIPEQEKTEIINPNETSKSNYQLNLINENLLKIKILTNKNVRIESTARDKKIHTQIQSNKIILKPKSGRTRQQIEITMSIEAAVSNDRAIKTEDGKSILIPNPEVVDLIRPPDYSSFTRGGNEYPGESDSGYQNPFDSLRKLIRKNLTIGIIAAIILHSAVAAVAFYTISKKTKDASPEEPTRLIVLQDLPDPKIKIEDVEDPNKPKIEEPVVTPPEKTSEPNREITPRRIIKPPVITRPKKEREDVKLDSAVEENLTRELDSLRKLVDETVTTDSSALDTTVSAYEIPDSLKNNFSENDIGLAMYFPNNWKLTDQRDINKNEKDFKGVVLTDTTAEQPGTMSMFIFLDNENKDYNAEDFKTEFKMNDSTLSAFSKEPKTLAGFTEYRFYIFNNLGTEKLSLRASVRKQFFDQYKNEIEAVVRSIRIRKKEDL